MDLLTTDLNNCIDVLEQFITQSEQDLIDNHQGGDTSQWNALSKYKLTLNNLKLIKAIYG